MPVRTLSVSLALLSLPSLAFAAAQEPVAPRADSAARSAQDEQVEMEHFMTASDLLGKDLWSSADADGDRNDCGDIRDILVDSRTGEITDVIISSGGVGTLGDALRKVPYSMLQFDRSADSGVKTWVAKSERQFDALEKLADDALEPYRAESIAKAMQTTRTKLREASTRGAEGRVREAAEGESCIMLASELDDLQFRASVGSVDEDGESLSGDTLSKISEAWISCEEGKVSFLTFSHNDRTLVMPLEVLRPDVDTNDNALFLTSPRPLQALMLAPHIDEKLGRTVSNAKFRASVVAFYAKA